MFKDIIDWFGSNTWSFIDGAITIITLIIVAYNFLKAKKEKELQLTKILIIFKLSNGNEILVDKNLPRKDISRSEIQGVLRTKLKKGIKAYDIEYLKTDKYFENIYDIQAGKKDKLVILLNDDELEQFDLKGRQ